MVRPLEALPVSPDVRQHIILGLNCSLRTTKEIMVLELLRQVQGNGQRPRLSRQQHIPPFHGPFTAPRELEHLPCKDPLSLLPFLNCV